MKILSIFVAFLENINFNSGAAICQDEKYFQYALRKTG